MSMVKLGEICSFYNGGAWSQNDFSEIGYPVLKVSNCKPSGFVTDDISYIPIGIAEKSEINKLHKGDVIIATVGSHPNLIESAAGRSCVVNDTVAGYYLNQNAVCLRSVNQTIFDQRYLGYLAESAGFKHYIQSRGKGAANQMRIAIGAIKEYVFDLPSIAIQRKIADILSVYDDLIENNQKQIKLLEEAAQRLYKEWFVDLRFPGHETTPIINGIPKSWISTTLGEICHLRKEMLTPDKIPAGLPYIGLEHMPRQDICLAEWGDSAEVSSNKFAYYEDDILFGKIRPYFHKVGFALNSGITSTDSIVMVANEGMWSLLLLTVSSTAFVDFSYQNCKEGSKMPRADWNQMRQYEVLIADLTTMEKFNALIFNTTRRMKAHAMQNRLLAEVRNRLLPKLMNGEIVV